MITDKELTAETPSRQFTRAVAVGATLKAARERMGLTEKEAATRLHLKPKVIVSIENEQFDNGLPAIFLRGYLRSYAKLLNFSEEQIKQLLIQLEISNPNTSVSSTGGRLSIINYDNNYANWATLLIVLLLTAMVGMWWKNHTQTITPIEADKSEQTINPETQSLSLPEPAITTASNPEPYVSTQAAPIIATQTEQQPQSVIGSTVHTETNVAPAPLSIESNPVPVVETTVPAKSPQEEAHPIPLHKSSSKVDLETVQMDLPEPGLELDN